MPKQFRRVFVSSTLKDLSEYRLQVEDVLQKLDYVPEMMEHFSAMDKNRVQRCLEGVDKSDIFIGIYAYRYGTCPPNSDISFIEMEFNRASLNGIPRLCFLVDESFTWTGIVEGEPGQGKLINLKTRIEESVTWATFTTPDKLASEVAIALRNHEQSLRSILYG